MKTLYAIFLLSAILLFSCSKVDTDHIVNLNNGKIDVIGHGGSGFQSIINPFPTNSFLSIKNAVDGLNVDGVEVDIQITQDSILIVYHDPGLEQSTNCMGCVKDKTEEAITQCIYNNDFGSRALRNETIIALSTLVNYMKDRSKKTYIFLNTKISDKCVSNVEDYQNSFAKLISKIIKENNAYDWISVYNGEADFLNKIKAFDPLIHIVYDAQNFNDGLSVCEANNINTMVVAYKDVTFEEVKIAHSKNIKVILWKLRIRKDMIGAVKKNPDGILTENIQLLQDILQK